MRIFEEKELQKIYKPQDSQKGSNGKVTIIGGSYLFHGAPLLSLKTASRVVDMVFFSSPEPSVGRVAEELKGKLNSFIWVPFTQIEEYIDKSDAVLIGPGLMRYHKEGEKSSDKNGKKTKKITESLLAKFPRKLWVIDAGSLHVMDKKFIPSGAILTPNRGEYESLFGKQKPAAAAKDNDSIIVFKNAQTEVFSPKEERLVKGGNKGLVKGGTGDVLAGLCLALVAKNPPFFSACVASFIVKKAADELYQKVGFAYNADDLAEKIPEVLGRYLR
ncbi:NAD(P)H-hydrate dehydratase [Candidatus Shapirobacteria bacterium]|nr:NAD(P)H-hydrate dehydratase [Candidatus Shapirobacteria bacterium]